MTGCLGSKKSLFLQLSSRWWFQTFFIFTQKIGEDEPILTNIFQINGWFNQQLVIFLPTLCLDVLLALLLHDFPETLARLAGVHFNFHHPAVDSD